MATLLFAASTQDKKVFTPVSSALNNLPNGAGTMIVFFKKSAAGSGDDFIAHMDSAGTNWYHAINQNTSNAVYDDDGMVLISNSVNTTDDTTNWWWYAVDWPSGASAATENFHTRNHTGGGSWTNNTSSGNNGGNRAGPGTGWFRIGWNGDEGVQNDKAIGLVAVWAGTRFSNSDYGTWTKTSDLYNHPLGKPTLLVELNTTTPVDIGLNPSTYSSGNSTGTTLTGANPDNFTFDGQGTPAVAPFIPHRMPLGA